MIVTTQYRCTINGKYQFFTEPTQYLDEAECSHNWLPDAVHVEFKKCPGPNQCFDAENINKANCPKQRGQLNIKAERVGEVGGAPLNVTASIEGEVKTQTGKLVTYYCTTGMTLGRIEPDTFTVTSGKMIQLLFFCQKEGKGSVSALCTGNDGSKLTAVSNLILCQRRPPTTVSLTPQTAKGDSSANLPVRIKNVPAAGLACNATASGIAFPSGPAFTVPGDQIDYTHNLEIMCQTVGSQSVNVNCNGSTGQASSTTQVTCTA